MGLRGATGTVFDIDDRRRVLEALANNNGNLSKAAKCARVPIATVRWWLKDKTEVWFIDQVNEITQEAIDACEEVVMRRARRTFKAAAFVLKHHKEAKKRGWGQKIELSGKLGLRSWKDEIEREV